MDSTHVYHSPPGSFSTTAYSHFSLDQEEQHLIGYQPYPVTQQAKFPNPYPPRTLPAKIESSWAQSLELVLWATLASGSFVLTAWFAQATLSSAKLDSTERKMHITISSTLGILRTLQEVTSVLTGLLLNFVMEALEWGLASSKNGTPALTFLVLSPTTSLLGLFGAAFGRASGLTDRFWAVLRLTMLTAIWVSGFVLFFNTVPEIVYQPSANYFLTAGTGSFNASYVEPYTSKLKVVPYGTLYQTTGYVKNSEYSLPVSPFACSSSASCESFLFPGGLSSTTPWPPRDFPDSPVVEIWNAPAVQLEFEAQIDESDQLSEDDCDVIGSSTPPIGIKVCIARSQVNPGALIARVYVCSNGKSISGECLNTGVVSNISTTLSVYSRQATTINARLNYSIIAASELGVPTKNTDLDVQALRLAVKWLLDYTASNTPPISSPVFMFWNSANQMSSTFWQFDQYSTLQNLLAFPLIFFSDNSYANPLMVTPSPEKMVTYLPDKFSTSASLARPYNKIRIDNSMFVAYISLEMAALCVSWIAILVMLVGKFNVSVASSFPLIDFASKLKRQDISPGSTGDRGNLDELNGANNYDIIKRLKNLRLILRTDSGYSQNENWLNGNQYTPRRLLFLGSNVGDTKK